jgi:pimeloyl-ACP methyl ester carboxylesterase
VRAAGRRLARGILFGLGSLAGLASPAWAIPAPPPTPAKLELHSCRIAGLQHDALCGVLPRPLDPAHADGVSINLHVLVIPAIARQKLPDPVFFFAGGPGQSAIGLAGTIERIVSRLGTRRDLVLVDQRGTGHSAPLQCDTPAPDEALARALDRAKLVAAMDACRAKLERLPWGDLRFYTTPIAMADIDAVRAALGAERINAMGISYGTRAVLEYLRAYPQHVRRALIDGVAPADMTLPESFDIDGAAALDDELRGCLAEKACAAAHPALPQTWQSLLASLPRPVDVADPSSGKPLHFALSKDMVLGLVRPALYSPALAAMLPHAIEEAAAGRFGVLLALASSPGGAPSDMSEGQHFSVVCAEDVPRLAPAAGNTGGLQGVYRDVCAHWPKGLVPQAFYAIPRSPAPVLLLSGGLDPVTPPRHALRVAQALGPQARSVVVANNGHGTAALPCMRDVVYRWFNAATDAQALAVDTGCAASLPRPLAFQPPREPAAIPATNDPDRFDDASPPSSPRAAPPATKEQR